MELVHQIKEDCLLLILKGDLLGENSSTEILEIVNNAISNKIVAVAIDLAGVRYINSSGLGVLITLLTKTKNKEGDIVLINPSEQVNKLLRITRLDSVFTSFETKEEAFRKLKSK